MSNAARTSTFSDSVRSEKLWMDLKFWYIGSLYCYREFSRYKIISSKFSVSPDAQSLKVTPASKQMQATRFCMFDLPYTEYSRKSAQAYNSGTTAKSPSRLNFQIGPKNSRKFPFRSHDDQCTGHRTLIQDGHLSKDDVVWPICWPIGDIFIKQLFGVATQEGREGNVKGDRERKYQSLTLMTNHSNHLLKFSSKTLKYPKPVLLQLFHHL